MGRAAHLNYRRLNASLRTDSAASGGEAITLGVQDAIRTYVVRHHIAIRGHEHALRLRRHLENMGNHILGRFQGRHVQTQVYGLRIASERRTPSTYLNI